MLFLHDRRSEVRGALSRSFWYSDIDILVKKVHASSQLFGEWLYRESLQRLHLAIPARASAFGGTRWTLSCLLSI